MASVRVTRDFLWAPDGITARAVRVGEVLEGEGAEIALQMGAGAVLSEASQESRAQAPAQGEVSPAHEEAPAPVAPPVAEAAPAPEAAPRAKRKGR
jgi:hypothetical protein